MNPTRDSPRHDRTCLRIEVDRILEDRPLKAVIPGGSSCPVMTPDEIDAPMTIDGIRDAGSMFGTGGGDGATSERVAPCRVVVGGAGGACTRGRASRAGAGGADAP